MSIQELNQQVDTMSNQLKLAKTVAEVDAISTRYSDFICNTRESAYKDASQKQKNDFTKKIDAFTLAINTKRDRLQRIADKNSEHGWLFRLFCPCCLAKDTSDDEREKLLPRS